MTLFRFKPGQLSLQELCLLMRYRTPCYIESTDFAPIKASAQFVENIVDKQQRVYGINTGFGALAQTVISPDHLQQLQRNIVLSHACGSGELLPDDIVALILLLKINGLAQGFSGVRVLVIEALLSLYHAKVYPCIPRKGSVGASGDLAPLAHLALPLLGEGMVRHEGRMISAATGLEIAGLKPLVLAPKEGLALLNGLQVSTAVCLYALFQTQHLFDAAILAGAMSVEAACGSRVPFDEKIHQVRGHSAQCDVARMFRDILQDSAIAMSHDHCNKVQDPYSLRCQPQIMGAVLHQMRFVEQTLQVEANAVSDNPLIFVKEEAVLSGGNFHGEIISMAADNLALSIAEMGANSERRSALLIDTHYSGLPPFLVKSYGLDSGFMIAQVTAAALASENKALSFPRSVDSIPTSANQEDHVSMATHAGLRLLEMIDNTATILAIELLAAAQGLSLRLPLTPSEPLQCVYEHVRQFVPPYEKDRYMAPDIEVIKQEVLNGGFSPFLKRST